MYSTRRTHVLLLRSQLKEVGLLRIRGLQRLAVEQALGRLERENRQLVGLGELGLVVLFA
jgi:hypothetical protein